MTPRRCLSVILSKITNLPFKALYNSVIPQPETKSQPSNATGCSLSLYTKSMHCKAPA